jgi:hypothetical protein
MNQVRPVHISGYDRQDGDFYRTPSWVTESLLKHVTLRGPVWEPCCGDGAMATVLTEHGLPVVASDIADRGFGEPGVDFFACETFPPGCGAMVTNPPYSDGNGTFAPRVTCEAMLRFVRHALTLTGRANGQLALLVRLQWTAGQAASNLITAGPFDAMIALTRRIRWFDMGKLTNNGQHHHAWLFWDFQRKDRCPPRIVFSD